MLDLERAVSLREGLIDEDVFTDEVIYSQEMKNIFQRTWLFVGHESSLPAPGDYIVNYMGEDEVIVVRDKRGKVRVFQNKCLHRGNKVCLFDRGNQRSFTCTFHGWQYNTEGQLVGIPSADEAYQGELDRSNWGLPEVPRVSSYGGMIFASWDPDIISLDDYLGDLRWYYDRLLVQPFLGEMEVVGGRQKYLMPSNWKLLADNFIGDEYHVPVTHASYFKVLMESEIAARAPANLTQSVQIGFGIPSGVPHALGALEFRGETRPDSTAVLQPMYDRTIAERLGPEAVEWLEERERRIEEFMKDDKVKLYGSANGTIFPNFSQILSPGAFMASGLIQWHPKGPMMTEAWEWCAVEKDAPTVVKRAAMRYLASEQAAAGMIATDDTENFERSTDNMLAKGVDTKPFHYAMGLNHDVDERLYDHLRDRGIDVDALPGLVEPFYTEINQREFYRYYRQLMEEEV